MGFADFFFFLEKQAYLLCLAAYCVLPPVSAWEMNLFGCRILCLPVQKPWSSTTNIVASDAWMRGDLGWQIPGAQGTSPSYILIFSYLAAAIQVHLESSRHPGHLCLQWRKKESWQRIISSDSFMINKSSSYQHQAPKLWGYSWQYRWWCPKGKKFVISFLALNVCMSEQPPFHEVGIWGSEQSLLLNGPWRLG